MVFRAIRNMGLSAALMLTATAALAAGNVWDPSTYLSPSDRNMTHGEAECAIWLCLPGGFPSGCSAPHEIMIDRITSTPPKPPLPDFSSCAVSQTISQFSEYLTPQQSRQRQQTLRQTSSQLSYRYASAAWVPKHKVCETRWGGYVDPDHNYYGRGGYGLDCHWEPGHYVMNARCHINYRTGTRRPSGCTETVKYITVFADGVKMGETYFFNLW